MRDTLFKSCSCNNDEFIKVVDAVGEFMKKITTGKKLTLAQWMRKYIDQHPDYKHNSILPKSTMDDLLLTINEITKGSLKDENFESIFQF